MMDWQRIVLLLGIGGLVLTLLIRWNDYQEMQSPIVNTSTTTTSSSQTSIRPSTGDLTTTAGSSNSDVPEVPVVESEAVTSSDVPSVPVTKSTTTTNAVQSTLVTIHTDSLEVIIDTYGGDIVKAALPKQPISLENSDPLVILNRNDSTLYVAKSGLIGNNATDKPNGERPVFSVAQTSYTLADGQDALQVDLTLQQNQVTITKRFSFKRNDNLIGIQYLIDNQSPKEWNANFYAQIKRDDHDPVKSSPGIAMKSFLGVATTTDEKRYAKYKFKAIADGDFKTTTQVGGWVAMVQHYFISAWIPDSEATNTYKFFKLADKDIYIFQVTSSATRVPAGEQGTIDAEFYVGPKDVNRMEEIAPHLELTIDYGPLWFICKPIFHYLQWIHSWIGNWGFAIIFLTLTIKALFFPLSAAGYRSMAKMRKFSPRLAELKERYGDNRQKFQEEMMKLYKKEKVNPMGGCLPMLVQIPVFISLYWVLMESVDLRHAPFIFWIQDLSVKDPFYILPLLYGATFFFQQKLQPAVGDPTQQKIMQMMPIVFTFMFLFFASGLVLYWVVNGALSMAQQYVITKRIERADT